jgi:hypothetical protein
MRNGSFFVIPADKKVFLLNTMQEAKAFGNAPISSIPKKCIKRQAEGELGR